ncbi:helix-turn-helix domain-containing protein, partial [Brevundimonas sp.]|uniref:helix-turn-helix domain-containing protein n=1 Tax=Brevundimonas sp. TaxID=1871086 RepID=UPI003919640B
AAAAAAQADLQPIGDGPHPPSTDSPVRILDEEGHVRALDAIEGDLIRLAIERYEGHMSEIARRLGIGRSTLYRKVRENGLGDMAGLDGG